MQGSYHLSPHFLFLWKHVDANLTPFCVRGCVCDTVSTQCFRGSSSIVYVLHSTFAQDGRGGLPRAPAGTPVGKLMTRTCNSELPRRKQSTVHSENPPGLRVVTRRTVCSFVQHQSFCNPGPVCPVRGGRAPRAASLALITGVAPPQPSIPVGFK